MDVSFLWIAYNHSQLIFSIAEVFHKKINPHIWTQNVSCYTVVFSIDHEYKLSCERGRNPKGISACMIKMPALVGKGLEVLKHVWPSNVSMFILQRFRMFTQAWSAVTLSLGTHSERSDPSSGTTAGVTPAQLCGHCPAALESPLAISWEYSWVWAQPMWRRTSPSSPSCQQRGLMNARPERPPALRARPHNAAMPPLASYGQFILWGKINAEALRCHIVHTSFISPLCLKGNVP